MRVSANSFIANGLSYRSSLKRFTFVCAECRMRAACANPRAPFHASRLRHNASPRRDGEDEGKEEVPFTERMRRRIWGTDTPPGQKDPYAPKGTPGSEPNVPRERKKVKAPQEPEEPAPAVYQDTYVPAMTWDGLDRIGGPSGWWEEQWDQEHHFTGLAPLARP